MVDPLAAARRLRLLNDEEASRLELRRAKARELGRELARSILAAHPEVRRVWGFGSVFETWRSFRATSDIDLAVETGDVMALLPLVEGQDFSVDLVDLASCPSSLADFIRAQGQVLAGEQK